MRIYVKKMIDAKWGHVEYIVFREGEFQTPVGILGPIEIKALRDEIDEAIDAKLVGKGGAK
jgi:hypothetical protein